MKKLGKLPPTYDGRDFQFTSYLKRRPTGVLPKIPKTFGHENKVAEWGMLGNDEFGNCVFAGGAHETMLWCAEAGKIVPFSTESVNKDYAAVTGFDPETGANDDGTRVRDALKYRQKVGLLDANGKRHKIGAYLALEPGNQEHLLAALYLFGAVGIGFAFTNSAGDQFDAGQVWTVVPGAEILGGHYVPLVASRFRLLVCVTWARKQTMTLKFFETYCDEAWVMVSEERLIDGRTLEGFDMAALRNDLEIIKAGRNKVA